MDIIDRNQIKKKSRRLSKYLHLEGILLNAFECDEVDILSTLQSVKIFGNFEAQDYEWVSCLPIAV